MRPGCGPMVRSPGRTGNFAAAALAASCLWLGLSFWAKPTQAQAARGKVTRASARLIYVWFADGGAAPSPGVCGATAPPRFRCDDGGSSGGCQARIMRKLAALYRDFDVELVTWDPTPAPHFTVVVTSADAAWCGDGSQPPTTRGLAPVNCAAGGEFGNTAYVFSCDRDAATCARRIAQEQAHLVGLDHSASPSDVMYPFETDSAVFRDRSFRTLTPRCGQATQNSHESMLKRFGPRARSTRARPFAATAAGRPAQPRTLNAEDP